MEKTLKLYIDVNGAQTPFPSSDNQIEIGSFDYNARRMGGAPTISATVMWESCLDNEWTKSVYTEFNGERYYLKQTPTSSYDNMDLRYEHNLELVSERVVLDDVYFYDAVSGTPQEGDKPVSHSADFVFHGTIEEFVGRLNASLEYAGMLTWEDGVDEDGNAIKVPKGYYVEVDEGISSEAKFMSFSSQFMSNVLQEIYNTYELPYYFVGKTIHVGYTSNAIAETFRYGVDDALLSITKNNASMKVVNRVTGIGSQENIPYYYPNDTPKACGIDVTTGDFEVQVVDGEALEANTKIGEVLTFLGEAPSDFDPSFNVALSGSLEHTKTWRLTDYMPLTGTSGMAYRQEVTLVVDGLYYANGKPVSSEDGDTIGHEIIVELFSSDSSSAIHSETKSLTSGETIFFDIVIPSGYTNATMGLVFYYRVTDASNAREYMVASNIYGEGVEGWIAGDWEESKSSRELGLAITGTPILGDTITVVQKDYINPQKRLMPSIYRESVGDERFYNALNNTYLKEDGSYYTFANPFVAGRPVEQIVEFPDIKPTIKGVKNDYGQPIDEFLEFAFDINDNNEIDENENYIHSHFFAKLPRMPFNLFDHAIESGEMTVNMTGGSLGGCSFVIAVSEEGGDNTVQVDASGNLIRDDEGNVLCGVEGQGNVTPQPQQNDTRYNEVWIALKKDANYTTYARPTLDATAEDGVVTKDAGGTAIEGKEGHYLPYEGSTFVYTNILLPKSHITDAEERLKKAVLDYLEENNIEKFNFSITFSRIFFEENADILALLDENARLTIEYNNKSYTLYVSSYSYKMSEGELLPEISVELSEDLTVSQNALQRAISEVKGDLLNTIGNMDVLAQGTPYFLRKDQRDRAKKTITFEEGIEVGDYSEGTLGSGAKISVGENGSTFIEADYLKVRKKATFTTLTVQEMKSVGGEIVVSPAAMVCSSVEELEDAYRCYFNTADNDGKFIFNEFEVDDQARCQAFNVLGSRYYWRLVTAVGDDYIDLSKTDCDANSAIPQAGDAIVSLGNRTDAERQNAIVHSAYGEYAPSMTQYAGINSYSLEDKIVTRFSPKGNLITGQLTIKAGSSGLEALEEWASKQEAIENAQATADAVDEKVDNLEFGATNLLRNSGFTGDYTSKSLTDGDVLEESAEMYSEWDAWWTVTNVTKNNDSESQSGVSVTIASEGSLVQELYNNIVVGDYYMVSFRAKGTGSVTVSFGGANVSISLTSESEYVKYEAPIVPTSSSKTFTLSGTCTLCDLQLEIGNIASSWSRSFLDNSSDRAYWQSLKYLQQAIHDNSADSGGLRLGTIISVGSDVVDEDGELALENVTGGMNGVWNNDDSVSFWSGGTLNEAITTVSTYENNPTYQPTDTELAAMASYVVTHGGRAILNDAILRGYIYAKGGVFNGTVYAESGEFNGKVYATDGKFTGEIEASSGKIGSLGIHVNPNTGETTVRAEDSCHIGRTNFATFSNEFFIASSSYNSTEGICTQGSDSVLRGLGLKVTRAVKNQNLFSDEGEEAAIIIENDQDTFDGSEIVIKVNSGQYAGLRPRVVTRPNGGYLDEFDHTVIINNTSAVGLYLPEEPREGQTYRLIHPSNQTVRIDWRDKEAINVATGEIPSDTFNGRRSVVLTYCGGIWFVEYIELMA